MDNAYAMVVERYGEPLVRRNFPLPVPRDGEVRIRILATGICGSDVHVWRGQDERSHLPMILGHEGIGYVDAVRPGRLDLFGRELREGDLVVWNRGVSCKACYECLIKRRTYTCKHRWSYGFSKSILDYPYLNGSYASHMLLSPILTVLIILLYVCLMANKLYYFMLADLIIGQLLGTVGRSVVKVFLQAVVIGIAAMAAAIGGMLLGIEAGFAIMILVTLILTFLGALIAATSFNKMEVME